MIISYTTLHPESKTALIDRDTVSSAQYSGSGPGDPYFIAVHLYAKPDTLISKRGINSKCPRVGSAFHTHPLVAVQGSCRYHIPASRISGIYCKTVEHILREHGVLLCK